MRRVNGAVLVKPVFKILFAVAAALFSIYFAFELLGFFLKLMYFYNFLTAVD